MQTAQPSKDLNPDLRDEYFNVGLVNHVRKGIDLALVYKHEQVDGGGTVNTSNGVIGGLNEGTYDEYGLWCAWRSEERQRQAPDADVARCPHGFQSTACSSR
jgi:hypothetical protein